MEKALRLERETHRDTNQPLTTKTGHELPARLVLFLAAQSEPGEDGDCIPLGLKLQNTCTWPTASSDLLIQGDNVVVNVFAPCWPAGRGLGERQQ